MDTKRIILGVAVILVLAVLLSPYGTKKEIGGENAELSATVTLPNGTVQKITGISGFPAGGGSSQDRPPTPPE